MSRIKTSHGEAKLLHPKEYAAMVEKHRVSKTQTAKTVPFEELSIVYDWGEQVEGFSLAEVLAGKRTQEPKTFEDRLAVMRKNVFASLIAFRKSYWISEKLTELPQAIIDQAKDLWEKGEAEKKRVASLTPDQRDAELSELLGKLAGPGFAMIARGPSNLKDIAKKAGVKIIGR